MNDEHIARLLRELPREKASPLLKAGVLHRLRSSEARRPLPARRPFRRLALAAGAAAMVVAGAFGVNQALVERSEERERSEALARLEALEAEKQALEAEIRELQRLARDSRPVVYLGSTPELDVVVDLGRLASRRENAASARFANYPSEGDRRP